MTETENPFQGLQRLFKEVTGSDECEVCGSQESVELQKIKPLNPIEEGIEHAWMCADCRKGTERQNEVAEQVKSSLSMMANGMAETYLEDVNGFPLWGEPALNDVTEIDGIGDSRAEMLEDAGFDSIEDLHEASVNEIAESADMSKSIAWSIKEGLQKSARKSLLIKARARSERHND